MIELRNVSKRFGALQVLDGVDLSLRRGETTVVIGESGTGKSVLLKHIIGLLRPDSGEIWFDGQRIDTLNEQSLVPIRRRMGFLFQMAALFDSMTVGENVGFPLTEHSGLKPAQIDEIVAEKMKMVGLTGLQDRTPGQISGGQKKRVALARAIALDPEVVFYDEPTTGLDPVRADVINEMILKLKRELQVTGIVVTHDMVSAFKVGDRIVMLNKGRIIADAVPDWFRTCDDPRVRRFVDGRADKEDLRALEVG
ncbi:MAG: ABC transporter ATP-binding protein [Phycisphaerales bacterium]|nr:ABC transporter ATP-binding protein [Phycisphaerales bacterium]MCB9855435.1 ABC transporter ATP-binding protein [Phycisphaerales bacterium]